MGKQIKGGYLLRHKRMFYSILNIFRIGKLNRKQRIKNKSNMTDQELILFYGVLDDTRHDGKNVKSN